MLLLLGTLMVTVGIATFTHSIAHAAPDIPRLVADASIGVTVVCQMAYLLLLFARPQHPLLLQVVLLSLVVVVPVLAAGLAVPYLRRLRSR